MQECCLIAEQMVAASKAGRITIRSDPAYSTELVKYDAGNKGEQLVGDSDAWQLVALLQVAMQTYSTLLPSCDKGEQLLLSLI